MKFFTLSLLAFALSSHASAESGELKARALRISNISIGAGVDVKGGRAIQAILGQELKTGILVRYAFVPLAGAIEGDYDICAEFKTREDQERVARLIRKATVGSYLIRLADTKDCVGI